MGTQRDALRSLVAVPPKGMEERRGVCRYSVVQSDAWIGWWAGQEFQSAAALIIDISLRGALLNVDAFPPNDASLWFCPPGRAQEEEWLEVKLVGTKKRLFGPRELRIAFRRAFPYDSFKALVYGQDAVSTTEPSSAPPSGDEERDWW